MNVRRRNGYDYCSTPAIILKGNWLKEAGFDIGDYVSVSCENGKLIITPDVERKNLIQAEKEFMKKEIGILKKRFKEEQRKLRTQFVSPEVTLNEG